MTDQLELLLDLVPQEGEEESGGEWEIGRALDRPLWRSGDGQALEHGAAGAGAEEGDRPGGEGRQGPELERMSAPGTSGRPDGAAPQGGRGDLPWGGGWEDPRRPAHRAEAPPEGGGRSGWGQLPRLEMAGVAQTGELWNATGLYQSVVRTERAVRSAQGRRESTTHRQMTAGAPSLTVDELDRAVRRDSRRYDGAMELY